MTEINIITKLFITVAVILVCAISPCTSKISDRRLCVDPLCSVPISEAITVMQYTSNDHGILSFPSNAKVTVFSKSAGNRQDLWGVEINGKRGYAPLRFVKEKRVFTKKLIHEVPTENIANVIPVDGQKNNKAQNEENAQNTGAKAEDTQEKVVVAETTEKLNTTPEKATVRSVPASDRVSPSYEVHDGTTISLSRNEEPTTPSYATQLPRGKQNIEQAPILSFYPRIASTVAFKTGGQLPVDESANDDDEEHFDALERNDESLSDEIAVEATSKLPKELLQEDPALPPDANYTSDAILEDSAKNPYPVADGKPGEATEKASVPSSQESQEKATVNANFENENNANNTGNNGTNTELKQRSSSAAADLDNQTPNQVGDTASQKPLSLDQVHGETVETFADATDKNPASQNNSVPAVDDADNNNNNNNNISINTTAEVADSSGAVDNVGVSDDFADADVADEDDEEDNEAEEEEEEENDESDDLEDSSPDASKDDAKPQQVEVEDKSAIEHQPAIEEPVETKSAEEPPAPNVNPLFSHLSKIPDVVKQMVKKAMASDDSDETATDSKGNAVADESETKNSNVNEISESSEANKSPPVDFSTDTNSANEYQNETDNSKPAVDDYTVQEAASSAEADNVNKAIATEGKAVADEPEATNTNSNENSENSEAKNPTVEFSTDSSSANQYQNGTDNSKPPADYSEESTSYPEAENMGDKFANSNNIVDLEERKDATVDSVERKTSQILAGEGKKSVQPGIYEKDELAGFRQGNIAVDESSNFNGFPGNRNLLNVGSGLQSDDREYGAQRKDEKNLEQQSDTVFNDTELADKSTVDSSEGFQTDKPAEMSGANSQSEATSESRGNEYAPENVATSTTTDYSYTQQADFTETADACVLDSGSCEKFEADEDNSNFPHEEGNEGEQMGEDAEKTNSFTIGRNYWETLTYLVITALTTLLFSLGYYYIENTRRDGQLIAKINILEKELLVASKECTVLDDTLKSTKTKLDSIEDESFGSNEMVVSLKAELEASQAAKTELEDQVSMLEKELESATEAGLELERMLREILSTNNQDNPLAQSVEDLQTRLNAQQAANEALTNALNLKAQENETLVADLAAMTQKSEQLEVEVTRVTEELKHQNNAKSNLEQTLLDKVAQLEKQLKDISAERINLRKQLKGKEMELKDLLEVVKQMNINNLDFEKLYNVSRVKAEASQLLEERNELEIKLSEVEGAHQLLEEHVKLINEEVTSLGEQCKLAEKAKRDAETRVEVLSNFFKEKEAQRQKEEAAWLQKQGEVSSTVERLHTMQNEIHNYKQQIEMLKREILDQEREYKNQIAGLETKSHEHWVVARQNERRLEESKAEAGQLRNRLTLIEKNLNDMDPEAKLHRLEANGETTTSPQLFIGAEASSSPIMFTGSSGAPFPPPPSYIYGPPPPPFMPPPTHGSSGIPAYEVGQRPPPLGGRLSSPPPPPPLLGSAPGRYDDPRSPPPPLSPSMLPPFGHPPHRAYPPPFGANDRVHPPPPPHSSMLPPPPPPPLGGGGPPSVQGWPNETLPPLRNSGFRGHQQHQRDHHQQQQQQQRARNHKGSLHSSGESLDKNV